MKKNESFLNACGCGNSNMSGEQIQDGANDLLDTVQTGAVDIFDAVKSTGGFIVDESTEVIDKLKDKGQELDSRPRVIKPIRNSVLVYGALGVLIFALVK